MKLYQDIAGTGAGEPEDPRTAPVEQPAQHTLLLLLTHKKAF